MAHPSPSRWRVGRIALPPLPELEKLWRELESRSETHSLFISWDWIGLWLEHLPRHVELSLLKVELDERVVALAVLCARTVRRRGLGSRALFFNSTGDRELDELTIEYNDLLAEPGLRERALEAALAHLAIDPDWDELFFDGWQGEASLRAAVQGLPGRFAYRRAKPTHCVDLEALRQQGKSHLDMLPGRVRYKARRTFKKAGELGELAFDVAATQGERRQYLAGLRELHQSSWQKRGMPGSFANAFFTRFHEELVRRDEAGSLVQLGRVTVGGKPVGYLYNLVHRRRVSNYQSGFDFEHASGTDWRPGMMCHLEAIAFNRNAGMACYDFLAGDHAYKRELGTPAEDLVWLVFQRPRLKFKIADRLISWGRMLRGAKAAKAETQAEAEAGQE